MKLADYLRRKRLTLAAFSAASGVSLSAISKIRRGARPRFDTIRKIEAATQGKVRLKDYE